MNKVSFDQLRQRIDKMFTPDINFKWIPESNYWHMTQVSPAGKIWMKQYQYGIKLETGKMIVQIDDAIRVLGQFGLCYQIEDAQTLKDNDTSK